MSTSSSSSSSAEAQDSNRVEFYQQLEQILRRKNLRNSAYIYRERYSRLVEEVNEAKCPGSTSTPLLPKTRVKRLKRFDVCGKRLCGVRVNPRLFFVAVEELYSIIHTTHVSGHLGRNRMMYELKKNYKNVTYEAVNIYLKLCRTCVEKKSHLPKPTVVKPIVEETFNDRCQVDLIDLQSCPDGEWRFIFVYQDHLTKFVQLKALRTKQAGEVAAALADVFHTFGAPCILQSDNGREFVNGVVEALVEQWPYMRIVHGAPRHSQSQGSVERANRDIKQMLSAWLVGEQVKERGWGAGLPAVQFQYNTALHSSIGQSPYECLFGVPVRRGLTNLITIHDLPANIRTEEELLAVATNTATSAAAGDHEMNVEDEEEAAGSRRQCGSHPERRALAERCLRNQASRMLRRTRLAQIRCLPALDDTVRLFVPDLDRGPLDPRNLLACVIEMKNHSDDTAASTSSSASSLTTSAPPLIRVATRHGVLNRWWSPNQYERVEQKLVPPDSVRRDFVLSLRQAVAAESHFGGQGVVRCHCRGLCQTKKCSCRGSGVSCSKRCHRTGTCSNMK